MQTKDLEYQFWYAIFDLKEGKALRPDQIEAMRGCYKQLKQAAEVSNGERKQINKWKEQSAAWHARFEQMKRENNELRKQIRQLENLLPII